MDIKLFEVRDRATCMPVLAIQLANRTQEEFWLLRRAGYAAEMLHPEVFPSRGRYVVLNTLDGMRANYDPYAWGGRTLPVAHQYIIDNWTTLTSGQVIDVRHVLGETPEPAVSERLVEVR